MKKKQYLKSRQKWNLQIVFNIIVIVAIISIGIKVWQTQQYVKYKKIKSPWVKRFYEKRKKLKNNF